MILIEQVVSEANITHHHAGMKYEPTVGRAVQKFLQSSHNILYISARDHKKSNKLTSVSTKQSSKSGTKMVTTGLLEEETMFAVC